MPEFFEIKDEDFVGLKGKVIIITGGSSGIGLATVDLLLSLDAVVVTGDMQESPVQHQNHTFQKCDVTSWDDQLKLFKYAIETHGHIDHVFANAGIGSRTNHFDIQTDSNGDPAAPDLTTYETNLKGTVYTAHLAIHYFRKQKSAGSVVATASAAGFQRFPITDYTAAKHGVLGFMRGIGIHLRDTEIRFNGIAPSWTFTGLFPADGAEGVEGPWQKPDVVARAVAVLMADIKRRDQMIYIVEGKYKEVENGVLMNAADEILDGEEPAASVFQRIKDKAINEVRA